MNRIEELQEQFPNINRSIILKMDLLREGIRFSPFLNEIGRHTISHFIQWNPEHDFDVVAKGSKPDDWLLTPWNLRFRDGTTVKTRFWNSDAPYEIRGDGDGIWLYRNGERIEKLFFHRSPDWIFERASDGTVHGTMVQLWAPECWYAVSLRYCQYTLTGDQCRFCCLTPQDKGAGEMAGLGYKVAMKPDIVAETFRVGAQAGKVKHFALTGGAILNNTHEIKKMAGIFRSLNEVRNELGVDVKLGANPSGLERHELATLKDAGADTVTINLEVWDKDLWPIIVPGKEKFFGRDNYLDSLKRAADVYGDWNVNTYFVTGTETVPDHFSTHEAAIESVVDGFSWCIDNKILPCTTAWLPAPGSLWENKPEPPTEYYLKLGYEIHQLMKEKNFYKEIPPEESCQCQECQDCSINIDYYYLENQSAEQFLDEDLHVVNITSDCDSKPAGVKSSSNIAGSARFKSAVEFIQGELPRKMKENPKRSGGFNGSFSLDITGENGCEFTVIINGDTLFVQQGFHNDAVFSIKMKDKHFVRMVNGELSGQMAFLTGKIRLKGSKMNAMKLRGLLFD